MNPSKTKDLTPRQNEIHRRLSLIGPGPSSFFLDACRLVIDDKYQTRSHLVGHCLREIESALRDVFEPFSETLEGEGYSTKDSTHKKEILKILNGLSVSLQDPVAKKWLALADKSYSGTLHKRAHRVDLTSPRPIDEDFLEFWEDILEILDNISSRFESRFLRCIDMLDDMISKESPTYADAKSLRQKMPINRVTYTYFFTRLSNPSWLNHLYDVGFFTEPSEAIQDKNESSTYSDNSSQADYLKRLALQGDPHIQEKVLEIMLESVNINNYFVHRSFTEAALAMPATLAAKWAKHEVKWLQEVDILHGMLEDTLGRLVTKLAKEGQPNEALDLAKELLVVLPDPEEGGKTIINGETEERLSLSPEPRYRCEEYYYQKILEKSIPELAKATPYETLEMLCQHLRNSIIYSLRKGESNKPGDFSYIHRPAIEDHEQNSDYTIDCLLITAVRDVAEGICRSNPSDIQRVIKIIESYEWNVFKRIDLYLLQVMENAPLGLIKEQLLDKELFYCTGTHYEYYHLLKKYFGRLTNREQNIILSWIDTADKWRVYVEESETEFTPEQKEKKTRWWQYHRLIPIQEHLTDQWKQLFIDLREELGEPSIPPDLVSCQGGGWIGPISPKETEDLAHMTIENLVEYLKEWKPSGEWGSATPRGLGRSLESLVAGQPNKFIARIELFISNEIDPTYIGHLVAGFCNVLDKKTTFPYEPVLRLCSWITEQPQDIPGRKIPSGLDDFDVDNDWANTRREIARLLDKLFDDKLGLSFDMRYVVWNILEQLTNDPDPSLSYEKEYEGDNMAPYSMSINSVRGQALHATFRYALWVCRKIKENLQENENRSPSLKDIPEVQRVIELRFDQEKFSFSKNQTDRAVFGRWLPKLIYIDTEWVKDNLRHIFPKDSDHRPLREAAWNTYLLEASLYDQVFGVIRCIYEEEVRALIVKTFEEDVYRSPETKLVEHVVIMYAREKVTLDEGDLLHIIFSSAPTEVRAYAIDFMGRSMRWELEQPMIDRFKEFWEWRIKKVGGIIEITDQELSAFGWWFASGRCGEDWAFPYLEKTLKQTDIGKSNREVFEHINSIFGNYPKQSLRCLRLFVYKNQDPWFFHPHEDEAVWKILEKGIAYDDSEIQEAAEGIIHLLGSKGYLLYRELLKKI